MAKPDMDVIKEIPGYKVILKAVLKSQIQQLVEQLATSTDEESVILTASVVDGTLSHLGSDSGKTFLEDHEDVKSQFLGFCLKRHHKKKQEEDRVEKERQEALSRPPLTPPRYGAMGPRGFMAQRSPRFGGPRGPGLHPVALQRAPLRMRHEPYPMARPPRRGPGPGQSPTGIRPPMPGRLDGQIIKIEPDGDGSNQGDSADASQPSSPSVNPSTPLTKTEHADDDEKSESSSSTIPNETSDLGVVPPGGLSLDSDFSNIISAATSGMGDSTSVHDTSSASMSGFDPNVSVKTEEMVDSEMDLEITGVELGQGPSIDESMGAVDWGQNMMGGMPTGATGGPGDLGGGQQGYTQVFGYSDRGFPGEAEQIDDILATLEPGQGHTTSANKNACKFCSKVMASGSALKIHERIHTGERPFKCSQCSKSFAHKGNLKAHYIVHLQDK